MHIVYDNIIFSLQKAGGISSYWSEMIRRFVKSSMNICFYGRRNDNIFATSFSIKQSQEFFFPTCLLRYLPFTRRLPKGAIFHSSYYRVSLQGFVKTVVTVHDFTYERFGHGLTKEIHRIQKSFALKRADGIICVSQQTEKDLRAFFPHLSKPVKVIYHGVNEAFKVLSDLEKNEVSRFHKTDTRKIILFVGGRKGYKNFLCAIEALSGLETYRLVLVGGGKLSRQERELLEQSLQNRFTHYLSVSEVELNVLYNMAFCLLYPSLYEGFGLPVLEAMSAGCPVVALRRSSIPEVAGNAAILCDTDHPSEIIERIQSLENESVRKQYIEKGIRQSHHFHWDKCFSETVAFYEQIVYADNTSL